MTEIEKLLNGRRISRDQFAAAKKQFETAYANADEDTRAKIDGLMRSSQNYSSANPMNNRSAREYQTQLYLNAINIMNGDYTGTAPSPGVSTPNMFNGYSHIENANNANDVTSRYMSHAQGKKTSGTVTEGKVTTSGKGTTSGNADFYRFNALKGILNGYKYDTDTLNDRIESMAQILTTNITKALDSNKKIIGANANDLQLALNMLSSGSYKDNIKQLGHIAQLAGVDFTTFSNYFDSLMPGQSAVEKNKKAREEEGWEFISDGNYGDTFNKMIADNKWIVGKKDGKTYVLNSDYSGPITGKGGAFVNTDYNDPTTEGFGWVMDNEGSFITGDMHPLLTDLNNPFYSVLNNYIKSQDNENRWIYNPREFDQFASTSKSNLVNTFAKELHKRKFADVSKYFDGLDIIATVTGDNFEPFKSKYGHLMLNDPRFTFYYKDKQGNFKQGTLALVERDLGKVNLSSNASIMGLDLYESKDYNLDGLSTLDPDIFANLDINGENEWHNWFSKDIEMTNEWSGEKLDTDHAMSSSWGDNENKVDKFVRLLLYIAGNWESLIKKTDRASREMIKTYEYWLGSGVDQTRREGIIRTIYESIINHPEGYIGDHYDDYRIAFQSILNGNENILLGSKKSQTPVQASKNGGILKAAVGTTLDAVGQEIEPESQESYAARVRDQGNRMILEQNAMKEKADANGKSVKQQREIDANLWTTSDTLRATALATDIAGLIAAASGLATSGAGSVAAVGAGFVSTGLDAIADFTDDKVSTADAWKNVAVNAGLSVTAFLGGKAPKIIKSITKMLPRAITAIAVGGVALDPDILKSVKNLADGKRLKVEDYRNLMWILKTAAGIGNTHVVNRKAVKGTEAYQRTFKKKLSDLAVNSELNDNIKYVANNKGDVLMVDKARFDAADIELKKKSKTSKEDALSILTNTDNNPDTALSRADAESLLESVQVEKSWRDKAKFWRTQDAEEIYQFRQPTEELLQTKVLGADVVSDARIQTIADLRQQAQTAHRFNWLNQLEGTKLVESYNPALGAAMNEAQARGWTGKTVNELIDEESKNLRAFAGSELQDSDLDLSSIDKQDLAQRARIAMRIDPDVHDAAARNKVAFDDMNALDGKLKNLEKSRQKQQTVLDKAEADLQTATLRLEAAEKAYADAKAPNKELGKKIVKARSGYRKAVAAEQQAVADKAIADKELADALANLQNSEVFRRNARVLAREDLVTRNSRLIAERAAKQQAVDQARVALLKMQADPIYETFFTKTGQLKKGVSSNKAKPIVEAQAKLATLEADLKTWERNVNNKILEGHLWDSYVGARNRSAAAAQAQADAKAKQADINNMIANLRQQIADNRANPQLQSMRSDVDIAKTARDNARSVSEQTRERLNRRDARIQTTKEKLEAAKARYKGTPEVAASDGNPAKPAVKGTSEKLREAIAASRLKNTEGKNIGSTRRPVEVTVEGKKVKVPEGTEVTSYRHLRDANIARQVVLSKPDMKELSRAEINKIIPSNVKVNGAAINTSTGEIAIWKKGGLLAQRAKGVGTPELIRALCRELSSVGYSKLEIDRLIVEKSGDEIRRLISRRRKSKK